MRKAGGLSSRRNPRKAKVLALRISKSRAVAAGGSRETARSAWRRRQLGLTEPEKPQTARDRTGRGEAGADEQGQCSAAADAARARQREYQADQGGDLSRPSDLSRRTIPSSQRRRKGKPRSAA